MYIIYNSDIYIAGAIEIAFTGSISLEFAMGGMIEQPFGNENLAFGNLYLSVGYSFGPVPLPSFGKMSFSDNLFKKINLNSDSKIETFCRKQGYMEPNKTF